MHRYIHSSHSAIKKIDDLAVEAAIQDEVDKRMAMEDSQSIQLLPPAARREKIEHEVRASADFSEFGEIIFFAFEILRKDNLISIEDSEKESLQESLDELCLRLENVDIKELTCNTMQEALAMPSGNSRSHSENCHHKI